MDIMRQKVADEIRYLEFPPEWKPQEVLAYVVRKLENGQAPRQDSESFRN
jgi:hypothetical protein